MDKLDLIWGADDIAKAIGLNRRQTYHLLEGGHLPAKRVGGKWVASRAKLIAALTEEFPR